LSNSEPNKIQFNVFIRKYTIVILVLGFLTVILALLSNYSVLFSILLVVDLVTLVILGAICIFKIIRNTIKSY
jgi:VIT1/CCC1 family predicted Fe2+/Mn2+ transporter